MRMSVGDGVRGKLLTALLGLCVPHGAQDGHATTPGPTDWSDWEKYGEQVTHPAGLIKSVDLDRAARNIARYPWAKTYADSVRKSADKILAGLTADHLTTMVEWTTPGCVGPCPACRHKGMPWHPNGQWSWSASRPDQLKCKVCQTVFPDAQFPEDIVVECKWGRGQKFTFIGGETFKCFGYGQARPSISGIIRSHKVNHITGELGMLGLAHALTRDPRYARGAKAILLRFAEVFPEYLVRSGYGYGEYAGMDPHVAAERINDLPEDELVYPPNRPNRKLHAGYWAASRIGTSGMDGGWVVAVATAYDLTCGATDAGQAVYSPGERRRIERDVLLEGTYLAACDPAINNKSVGNRTGAAVVGMVVGHPGLVRFGLDGFKRTVDEWFLPDGGTSESAAYAMMTMGGVRPFALAFRHYADPPGYLAPGGGRIDDFDACRDTRFGDCWQGLLWSLQGDLRFPPVADSYRNTTIGVSFAELLAVAYPGDDSAGLLKEIADAPVGGASRDALLYREPGFESRAVPPISLPDVVFPFLSQGYLRTGGDGRESLLLLNASDWGGHHHRDSLDIYYWKDGRELLSDLGYLWDHPEKPKTSRTFAHNLVMIDRADQATKGRGGRFHLFSTGPAIKVMEAASDAYGTNRVYRRTCAVIDHGHAGSYVLDVFRAAGPGGREYVFHGPNNNWKVEGLEWSHDGGAEAIGGALELKNVKVAEGGRPWRAVWSFEDGYTFEAIAPACHGEKMRAGDGWGQRDHRNTDVGAVLPYVMRTVGDDAGPMATFVSVFCGNPRGRRLVKCVNILPMGGQASPDAIAIGVETTLGSDVFISMLEPRERSVATGMGSITTDGRFCAALTEGGHVVAKAVVGGTLLSLPGSEMRAAAGHLRGKILGVGSVAGSSYFDVESASFSEPGPVGQTFFVVQGNFSRGYPIRGVERTADGRAIRIFVKRNNRGFEARPAESWELPVTSSWTRGK